MNLRKLKNQAGFTLVELIVVIAIMAILAGVAVPVYSGYIEKAEKAGDLQLLGAVNSAFGAACVENDTAPTDLPNGSVTFYTNSMLPSKYEDEFKVYFAGNEGSFKVIKQLLFMNGVFVDPTSGNVEGVTAVSYAGGTLYVTDDQIADLAGSTYNDIGFDALLDKVDFTLSLISGLDADDPGAGVLAAVMDEDYMKTFVAALGGDATLTGDALTAEFGRVGKEMTTNAVNDYIKENNLEIKEGDEEYTNLYNQTMSEIGKNMLVLHAAQSASSQSKQDVMAVINSSTPKADLLASLKDPTSGAGIGSTALVYGAFTAYANSNSGTDAALNALNNKDDVTAVFDLLENETERKAFQDYMATAQGQADLEAAMSAMNMINNNASDKNALTDVLVNGYNNDAFVGIVEGLVNPSTEG